MAMSSLQFFLSLYGHKLPVLAMDISLWMPYSVLVNKYRFDTRIYIILAVGTLKALGCASVARVVLWA